MHAYNGASEASESSVTSTFLDHCLQRWATCWAALVSNRKTARGMLMCSRGQTAYISAAALRVAIMPLARHGRYSDTMWLESRLGRDVCRQCWFQLDDFPDIEAVKL